MMFNIRGREIEHMNILSQTTKRHWLLAGSAALLISACGQSGTVKNEDGSTTTYSTSQTSDGGQVDVETKDGKMTSKVGSDLKVDMPEGYKIYPGSQVIGNTKVDTGEGVTYQIMSMAPGDVDEVLAFYRKQAENDGVTISNETSIDGSKFIGGERKDGGTVTVQVVKSDDGGTMATFTLSSIVVK